MVGWSDGRMVEYVKLSKLSKLSNCNQNGLISKRPLLRCQDGGRGDLTEDSKLLHRSCR